MELQHFNLFNELDVAREDYTLKVRIIRLWRQPMFRNPTETYSIEMILLDEEGNRIQAAVLNRFFNRFEQFLNEGVCLIITKPQLGSNTSKYKYIDNKLKVCLNFSTHVVRCNNFNGHMYGFVMTPYSEILNCIVPDNSSIDVIGVLLGKRKLEPVATKSGKTSVKMQIKLEDIEGNRIFVTLWDSYATEMSNYLDKNPDLRHLVIILQFGRFTIYNGRYAVSNSFTVSRLFINSDIDEVKFFRKSYLESFRGESSSSTSGLPVDIGASVSDEFLINTQFSHCIDVNLDSIKSVIVVGTIKCILPDVEWYYKSCSRCTKRVHRKISSNEIANPVSLLEGAIEWVCANTTCNGYKINCVVRFKVPVRVQDGTGVISLTIFEREMKKLIGRTGEEMVDLYLKDGVDGPYPNELNAIVDKKYAFKVDVTQFNKDQKMMFFGVSSMTDDLNIINELEGKYNLDQPISETNNLGSEDFRSPESVTQKASHSLYLDETPYSTKLKGPINEEVMNDNTSQDVETPGALKRKLVETFDSDDHGSSSANQSQTTGEHLMTTKLKLVVPKLEK